MFSCQPTGSHATSGVTSGAAVGVGLGVGVTTGFVPVPHIFLALLTATEIFFAGASRCTIRAILFSALTQATLLSGDAGGAAETGEIETVKRNTEARRHVTIRFMWRPFLNLGWLTVLRV
jgi:hypothetical protein